MKRLLNICFELDDGGGVILIHIGGPEESFMNQDRFFSQIIRPFHTREHNEKPVHILSVPVENIHQDFLFFIHPGGKHQL